MDQKVKQQVINKIKESSKILVTVSESPSVDALSAALGLTLLLDKQEKYATAIFSGETPPAIAFLEPEKTFDDTTDSLRDFIIALNKEKADHLRYKVEGEAVKIFITPYKTVINEKDLEFSQGDYNVELVIALGVDNQENLDKALDAHGQILHDADIITITAGDQTSDLGGIDWHQANASSLSEMVASLSDLFKDENKKSLLSAPIATALLTGIVAETERFSNERTSSGAMTVAAKLMGAGADQQLIANELEQAQEAPEEEESSVDTDGNDDAQNDDSDNGNEDSGHDGTSVDDAPKKAEEPADPSLLSIDHDETLEELDHRVRGHDDDDDAVEQNGDNEAPSAELEAALSEAAPKAEQYVKSSKKLEPLEAAAPEEPTVEPAEAPVEAVSAASTPLPDDAMPSFGGTLNATTERAADDARREEEQDKNKTILSHSYLGDAADEAGKGDQDAAANEFAASSDEIPAIPNGQSFVNSGEKVIQPIESPFGPAPSAAAAPNDFGLPLPPPLPDFSQGFGAPAMPPAMPLPDTQQPEILGDILAPESPETPVAPAVPVESAPQADISAAPADTSANAYGIDPSLFTEQPPIEQQVPELTTPAPADFAAPAAPATAYADPAMTPAPAFDQAAPAYSPAPAYDAAAPAYEVAPAPAYGAAPAPAMPAPADPGQFQIPTPQQ